MTRADIDALGFTRAGMRERDKIGWGGSTPKPEWRPSGQMITSPVHLWEVEQARDDVGRDKMGRAVPVHQFLWSVKPAVKPYLTKLGGVPWRPADRPWPQTKDGKPCTFVAQFCFADSRHLVSDKLPDDVMLVFFSDSDDGIDPKGVVIEWSPIEIAKPMTGNVPEQGLPVPELSGVIYESDEYPDGLEVAYAAVKERGECYLIANTQSTKIGRETWFIQNDPRRSGEQLFCSLSSVSPADVHWHESKRQSARWPLLDLERYLTPKTPRGETYGWSSECMTFGDVGAMYFLIDRRGRVRVTADCY